MGKTTTRITGTDRHGHPAPDSITEAAILDRILRLDRAPLSREAAESILALDFAPVDKERMHQLLAKVKEGTHTADEQAAVNCYERVGHLLNILQAKARRSLTRRKGTNGKGPAA